MNVRKSVLHTGTVLSVAVLLALSQTPVALAGQVGVNVKPPIQCFVTGTKRLGNIRSPDAGVMITPTYEKSRPFVSVIGSTPEEVQQKFAAVQEMNFSQGDAKLIISRLSDKEITAIAHYYNLSAPAGDHDLLRIFAQRLDSSSLIRVAKAFGSTAVSNAVKAYAPAKVRQAYVESLKTAPGVSLYGAAAATAVFFPHAEAASVHTDAAPSLGQDEAEIEQSYLDFRTARVGNTAVEAGLEEASIGGALNAGIALQGSWDFGTLVGSATNWLIEKYDPSLEDAIGGTVDNMLQDIQDAQTEFEQGQYESSIDSLFGVSISYTGDYDGDWGVSDAFGFYMSSDSGSGGGGC